MATPICVTCGTSFPDRPAPPPRCPICDEERQYVPASGQSWTTPDRLAANHANAWRQAEPGLFEIETQPRFGIGQRAFLLRTPHGNVLWDCVALLDPATVELVRALGGLAGIAISHPHYYTTMPDWAAAFDAPVYLHARDRDWVMRPDDRVVFWEEDERTILPGLDLLRLGGHFPGGTVLHWQDAAEGAARCSRATSCSPARIGRAFPSCGAIRTGCRSREPPWRGSRRVWRDGPSHASTVPSACTSRKMRAPSSAARRRATGRSWSRISPEIVSVAALGGAREQRRPGERAQQRGEAEPPAAPAPGRPVVLPARLHPHPHRTPTGRSGSPRHAPRCLGGRRRPISGAPDTSRATSRILQP